MSFPSLRRKSFRPSFTSSVAQADSTPKSRSVATKSGTVFCWWGSKSTSATCSGLSPPRMVSRIRARASARGRTQQVQSPSRPGSVFSSAPQASAKTVIIA